MRERKYRTYINGIEIDYYSNHRNKSKGNMEDLRHTICVRYDRTIYNQLINNLKFGYLIESEER